MIELVGVFVKNFDRFEVTLLAWSSRTRGLSFFDSFPALLQLRRIWRRPKRVIVAHRDTPVRHATLRIGHRDFRKRLCRFVVFERMQPRDGAIELGLRLWLAGYREAHHSELFRRFVLMRVHFLRQLWCWHGGDEKH